MWVVCVNCVSSLCQVCDKFGSNILVMCVSSASQGCDECVYWLSIVPSLIRAGFQVVSVEGVMYVSSL